MQAYRPDPSPSASSVHGQRARPGLAVLFVDPDVAEAERLAAPLRKYSAVAIVASVHEAMVAIAQHTPDVIVSEIELPDGSGVDLFRQVHGTAATRNVLLMVVTRRKSVSDKIAAFQAGADDYLVKPISAEKFETHVLLVSRFRKVIRQ